MTCPTCSCDCGEPLSRLNERLDELCKALARFPDLNRLIETMRAGDAALMRTITPDLAGAVAVLEGAEVRRSLLDVAVEIRGLRKSGAH